MKQQGPVAIYGPVVWLNSLGLALLIALLSFAASRMPFFPTDVAIARGVQWLLPLRTGWAVWITASAGRPWCLVLLALTVVSAWLISGWRAAAVAIPVFFGLWLFGIWLSPIVAQPRPSPELIRVVGHFKGYAFPSIFGLVYAATFGYAAIVAWEHGHGAVRSIVPAFAVLFLAIGASARIVVGAHWPSDLWMAYLMGLFWITLLLPLSRQQPKAR